MAETTSPPQGSPPGDPGLVVLVMLLRFHGIGADPAQIHHQFGSVPIGMTEMLRCAKEFGLKARTLTTNWDRLAVTAQYCQPWLRPMEPFTLSIPRETARVVSDDIRRMLGYSIHPPFIGAVDGLHPLRLLDEP